MHNKTRGPWIQVRSGGRFYPFDPRPDEIRIEDIAHALANICRYGGHCRKFYSVAQHSLHVAELLDNDPAVALCGLLHDASEAYLGDMPAPTKGAPQMAGYCAAHEMVERAVAARFGLPHPMPEIVKWADRVMLATEARVLMCPLDAGWAQYMTQHSMPEGLPPPMGSGEAREPFLDRYHALMGDVDVVRQAIEVLAKSDD